MLKVFLVEDETVIREGLRDHIPWDQYGYRLVGEASDGEAFNADFFNVASFSAVSAVSSASVSAPIRCSEPAANACGCHSHVFHINIADNAAAKIRFDFFLIPFSSH